MRRYATWIMLALAVGTCLAGRAQEVKFKKYFTGECLRVDCIREGSAEADTVWVERFALRNADWHGPRKRMIDPFDNGDYRVEMRDARSGRVIYSRGYSNLFREYKDTPEGRSVKARFEEVLLLPMPKGEVVIALQKRDAEMRLHDATLVRYRPGRTPTDTLLFGIGARRDLELHGSPAEKIDVAVVAQGYGPADAAKMDVDLFRVREILFGKEPFKSHRNDFNVYGVCGDAGAQYGTFDSDRYLMTFSLFRLHTLLSATPADYIIIMVNDTTYGGGAIYNFYSVTSLHPMAEWVLPHELGHGFGGLADEYVDEELSYADLHRTAHEPLEPNITNLTDFGSKWQSMVAPGITVPTPPRPVPRTECGPVGAYEGAGYSATGVYRPTMNCMMRNYGPFCPVCMKRLEEVFAIYK